MNSLTDSAVGFSSVGAIVSCEGSVVDIRFDEHLPSIYSVLRAGDEGRFVIEVLARWMHVTCAGLL